MAADTTAVADAASTSASLICARISGRSPGAVSGQVFLEVRGEACEGKRDREEEQRDGGEDLEGVDLADADRRVGGEAFVLALACFEDVEPADHGGQRRVLDDVDE